MVGLAFEVSGDTAVDGPLVRRYRDKFRIPFPLLLAGTNDVEGIEAALPQLHGAGAFPTILFLGRDGRVRRVHAGFHGLAAGAQHQRQVRDFEMEIEKLLNEDESVNSEPVNSDRGGVRPVYRYRLFISTLARLRTPDPPAAPATRP